MKSKNQNANENSDFPQDDYQDVLTSMEMFSQRAKLSKEKIVEFDEAFRTKLMATPELGKDILNFIVNLSIKIRKYTIR